MSRLSAARAARPPAGTGPLVVGTALLALGKGVFLSTLVVYLLQIVHVGPFAASLGAAAWGLAAVIAALPAGLAVDRLSPRTVGVLSSLAVIPALAAVGSTHRLLVLVPVVFVAGAGDAVGGVARRALLAAQPGEGVAALSWARTASNAGFAVGAVMSVPLLASHSARAYQLAYALAALTYAAAAVAIRMTPGRPAVTATNQHLAAEPRNVRVAAMLAASTAVLSLHTSLLDVAFPIWIVQRTSVPVSAFGWLLLLNTLLTLAGQIPAGKRTKTIDGALRSTTRSSWWTAGCCGLMAAAGFGPTAWQVFLLVLAMVSLTIGELLQSAGEWGLSALLAADHEHGFYQGACVFGESAQSSAGPLIVGALLGSAPLVGCGVLAGLVLSGRQLARGLVQAKPTTVPRLSGQPAAASVGVDEQGQLAAPKAVEAVPPTNSRGPAG